MQFSVREVWTTLHGMVFGAVFLLAFIIVLVELSSLRRRWVTMEGVRERIPRLQVGTWIMAVVAWITVLSGTYVIAPWYRAEPPQGADLQNYPMHFLLSSPDTRAWHLIGAEWKEHMAWFAPILATAVAYAVSYYGPQLAEERKLRGALQWLGFGAVAVAAMAGLIGALLNKLAPVR